MDRRVKHRSAGRACYGLSFRIAETRRQETYAVSRVPWWALALPPSKPRSAERYCDAVSFRISATASCTVVMNCAGKIMVEFLSIDISAIV